MCLYTGTSVHVCITHVHTCVYLCPCVHIPTTFLHERA